jgi:hypothetical protein
VFEVTNPCLREPPPIPKPVVWTLCAKDFYCLDTENGINLAENVESLQDWANRAWATCRSSENPPTSQEVK